MSRIQNFITHVASLLPSEDKDSLQKELMTYWLTLSEKETTETCTAIIKSGAKKGKPCGKTCTGTFCKTHSNSTTSKPNEVQEILCKTVMKTGPRKGQECGKVCKQDQVNCPSHTKCLVPAKEAEQEENREPKPAVSTCASLMMAGKRKGEACGKPCVTENACATHAKQKEKQIPSKPSKSVPSKHVCGVMLKEKNQICGKPCEVNKESCNEHDVIRIKKHGSLHIIKGTNVIFDMDTESAIGYLDDSGTAVYNKNDEVKTVCTRYSIGFVTK